MSDLTSLLDLHPSAYALCEACHHLTAPDDPRGERLRTLLDAELARSFVLAVEPATGLTATTAARCGSCGASGCVRLSNIVACCPSCRGSGTMDDPDRPANDPMTAVRGLAKVACSVCAGVGRFLDLAQTIRREQERRRAEVVERERRRREEARKDEAARRKRMLSPGGEAELSAYLDASRQRLLAGGAATDAAHTELNKLGEAARPTLMEVFLDASASVEARVAALDILNSSHGPVIVSQVQTLNGRRYKDVAQEHGLWEAWLARYHRRGGKRSR